MVFTMVAVAQLVRAPDCGSGGRGFETHQPPILRVKFKINLTDHPYYQQFNTTGVILYSYSYRLV